METEFVVTHSFTTTTKYKYNSTKKLHVDVRLFILSKHFDDLKVINRSLQYHSPKMCFIIVILNSIVR